MTSTNLERFGTFTRWPRSSEVMIVEVPSFNTSVWHAADILSQERITWQKCFFSVLYVLCLSPMGVFGARLSVVACHASPCAILTTPTWRWTNQVLNPHQS